MSIMELRPLLTQFEDSCIESDIHHIELDMSIASFGYDKHKSISSGEISCCKRIYSENITESTFSISKDECDDLFQTLSEICADIKSTVTFIIKPKLVLMIETPIDDYTRRIEIEMSSVSLQDFVNDGIYAFMLSDGPVTHLYYQHIKNGTTISQNITEESKEEVKVDTKKNKKNKKKDVSAVSTILNATANYIESFKNSNQEIPVLSDANFTATGMDITPPPSPTDYVNAKLADQQLKEFKDNFLKEEERIKNEESKKNEKNVNTDTIEYDDEFFS